MRIMIISDTHRQHKNLAEALKVQGTPDMLIHLGDAEGYEDYIQSMAGCPMEIVLGNNDFFSDLEKEKIIEIGEYRILITHGHYYYVSTGTERIRKAGIEYGVDIVMYGHTHRPIIEESKGIVVLNPGSISYPRQIGKLPSYIMMEIDDSKEASYEICYVE